MRWIKIGVIITWNTMIKEYAQYGSIDKHMNIWARGLKRLNFLELIGLMSNIHTKYGL